MIATLNGQPERHRAGDARPNCCSSAINSSLPQPLINHRALYAVCITRTLRPIRLILRNERRKTVARRSIRLHALFVTIFAAALLACAVAVPLPAQEKRPQTAGVDNSKMGT